jgi:hypothetical protein
MKEKRMVFIICRCIFLIPILLLGLTSCATISGSNNGNNSSYNEKQQIEEREKLVLETINTRDISSIKGMFSKSALTQISDIDGKLNEFLAFYSGKYISSTYSCPVGDDVENGNDKKSFYLGFTVTTDKGAYELACTYVVSDPKDPDDVGVCQLAIIHAADANSSVAWHSGSQDTPAVECFN